MVTKHGMFIYRMNRDYERWNVITISAQNGTVNLILKPTNFCYSFRGIIIFNLFKRCFYVIISQYDTPSFMSLRNSVCECKSLLSVTSDQTSHGKDYYEQMGFEVYNYKLQNKITSKVI